MVTVLAIAGDRRVVTAPTPEPRSPVAFIPFEGFFSVASRRCRTSLRQSVSRLILAAT